jgi:hypothetical protein
MSHGTALLRHCTWPTQRPRSIVAPTLPTFALGLGLTCSAFHATVPNSYDYYVYSSGCCLIVTNSLLPVLDTFSSMSSSSKTAPLYPIISDTPPFTLDVPGVEPVEGESVPRRNSRYVDKLLTQPEEGVATVFDIVTRAAQVFGSARAVGTRRLIKTHNETKKVTKVVDGREQQVDKKWTYFELSGYAYLSFSEYEQQVLQVGAGLRHVGLVKGDRLFLFAATRYLYITIPEGKTYDIV